MISAYRAGTTEQGWQKWDPSRDYSGTKAPTQKRN